MLLAVCDVQHERLCCPAMSLFQVLHVRGKGDRDENPERLYDVDNADDAGGITNRPLSEEVDNQEALPERGTNRDRTRNPDATRPEGDYTEKNR